MDQTVCRTQRLRLLPKRGAVAICLEGQFEILGAALNQLSRLDPDMAEKIPELPRIVAFRNILIHG